MSTWKNEIPSISIVFIVRFLYIFDIKSKSCNQFFLFLFSAFTTLFFKFWIKDNFYIIRYFSVLCVYLYFLYNFYRVCPCITYIEFECFHQIRLKRPFRRPLVATSKGHSSNGGQLSCQSSKLQISIRRVFSLFSTCKMPNLSSTHTNSRAQSSKPNHFFPTTFASLSFFVCFNFPPIFPSFFKCVCVSAIDLITDND